MGTGGQRVVFIGGRELGARCLRHLIDADTTVACIIARCDERPSAITPSSSVFSIAEEHGIPWLAPSDVRNPEVADWVSEYGPTIGICVMFPRILPAGLLAIPPRGFFNLHGAPLPAYRGCLGHVWAILNAETVYGVTLHQMTERLDAGPVVARSSFGVDADETGMSLHQKSVEEAYSLFVAAMPRLAMEPIEALPQDEHLARYYSKLIPFDRVLQWGWTAHEIDKFIRAMAFPEIPLPHTFLGDTRLQLLGASPIVEGNGGRSELPGSVLSADQQGIVVQTGSGSLLVTCMQVLPALGREFVLGGEDLASLLPVGSRLGRWL